MISTESKLQDEQGKLKKINEEIGQLKVQVTSSYLLPILAKQEQFQLIHIHNINNDNDASKDLQNLSITQLNSKSETINRQIQELEKLNNIKTNMDEIEKLLSNLNLSINSLLDLQHLSHLFKQIQAIPSLNYMIYKQVIRRVASLHITFVELLNNYLNLIVPDEFTILHGSVIGDFNQFVIKNGYNLSVYAEYKTKWDELIDRMFHSHEIKLVYNGGGSNNEEDDEQLEMKEVEGTDFISSLINFVTFINKINHAQIKNYLNSKISKLVAGQLFQNVEKIIRDQEQINQLNALMILCEDNGWNFLNKIEGSGTMEERLNKLHIDWIIDDYVGKIKTVLNTSSHFTELKEVQEEVREKREDTITNDNDTDWNESWDDEWDEEEEENQANDSPQLKQREDLQKHGQVKISQIPQQLELLFKQYSKYSKDISYLVSTIKALSLVQYPSLASSFVMYNDFIKLAQITGDNSLISFIDSNWNQMTLQFIQELKTLISSLNLESEVDMEDEILDDYNLNQLSLIYKWFQTFFESRQFRQTNFGKFQQLITELVDFANMWLIQLIFTIDDISENQCLLYSLLIDNLNNITIPILGEIGVSKSSIDSFNKANNVRFLLNNHLKDIIDRFYQGELFDLATGEMVNMIRSIFIQSEIRDNYINEIIEFRNMS